MINQDSDIYVNGIGYDVDIDLTSQCQLDRIIFYTENFGNSSVLELGVGDGVMLSKLEGQCSRLMVIDADEMLLNNYRSKNTDTKIELKCCYFEDFNTDEYFDVIHMGFILEHVKNPSVLITKFLKYLKPSGKLFISVPNAESLHRRIGFYAGLLESLYKFSDTDIKVGHIRYYDKKSLAYDIELGGGKIIALEGLFLKAITTSQIEKLNFSTDVLRAFCKVGIEYPELSNSLFAVVKKPAIYTGGGGMILKYGCAKLRAIELKDCELLLEMMNNSTVDKLVGNAHLPLSRENQELWIKNYKNTEETIRLMIELENGKTIGMVILQHIDYRNSTAEIGIKTFVKDFHDRMVNDVDDAYHALLDFAFNELNLNCIYAYSMSDNRESIRFNKRIGFIEEGCLRSRIYTDGIYKDHIAFSMLKSEFRK